MKALIICSWADLVADSGMKPVWHYQLNPGRWRLTAAGPGHLLLTAPLQGQ